MSGGFSSWIAGGDFWKGVREGLITSGLNHAMHSVVNKIQLNKSIREMLEKGGVDPDAEAPKNLESVNLVAEILNDLHSKTKCVEFKIVDDLQVNGKNVNGFAEISLTKIDGKYYILNIGKIQLSSRIFKTFFQLASTMIHEMTHVIDFHGDFIIWYNKSDRYASSKTEINANEMQIEYQANYSRIYYLTNYYSINSILSKPK